MRKTTAYILLAAAILTLASGCGRMENTAPQTTPKATATPVIPTPDADNGIVDGTHGHAGHHRGPGGVHLVRHVV